jgi:hypothetical protein
LSQHYDKIFSVTLERMKCHNLGGSCSCSCSVEIRRKRA